MKSKLLVFLVLFFVSCKSSNDNLYSFDPRIIGQNEIRLSEIADDITYIPLENSFPISLIYPPRYFINNSIYLSALNSGVIVFDRTGNYIRTIGSVGRGPGEYVHCSNFTVDDKNETVYVLDSRTIKVFSKTGNFQRSIPLEKSGNGVESIEFYNSNLFLSFHPQYEDVKNDWIILDTLGNLINAKKRTDQPFAVNWGLGGGMYKLENKIYLWNPWRDTIFSILPDLSYRPSFLFASWENRVPKSTITDLSQFKTYNTPNSVFETSHYLVCSYTYNGKIMLALIDKNNKKSYNTELVVGSATLGVNFSGGFFNDIDGGVRFQPENYFTENNREYMFGLIDAHKITALLTDSEFKNSMPKYPDKKKELENLATRLKETDNQLLMIVRLKKLR